MQDNRQKSNTSDISANDYICIPCVHKRFFSPEECSKIRILAKDLESVEGVVGRIKNERIEKSVRDSEVKWLVSTRETSWVFEKLMNAIHRVNGYYKFDVAGIEAIQIARYTSGGFYDWHIDIGRGSTSKRKLSVSVQLSGPEEYEGGDLQFMGVGDYEPVTAMGSAITFPSYLMHRVAPVTSGTRWSLVAWVNGNAPFL